jgi:uncharacterized protein (TIGR02118 family)
VSISVVALWKTPNDIEKFEEHYFSTHIALVRELPGLTEALTSKGLNGPYYRVAQLRFATPEDLAGAFGSEAGQKLMADTSHIQETFGATVDVLTLEDDAHLGG